MRKFLLIALFFSLPVVASAITPTVYLHETPEEQAKVIASMKAGEQLMPIIYSQKRDWVKVANPINGDVGWAKVDELKGPIIITKMKGSETQQIILRKNDKGKQSQVYSIIQYSGPQELSPKDAEKVVKDMTDHHEKMEKSMQKMREQMQKNMLNMFKAFDKDFYTFSVMQPIIVVPENGGAEKTKK